MLRQLARLANGLRKIAAGLTPFGESVWPGARHDLFVAHQSIYDFFLRHAQGGTVLDAGCGTGYGSAMLARGGATSVLGVDIDRRSIRYATAHYQAPNLRFQQGDCEKLGLASAGFDLVVASNLVEHLTSPEPFLASVRASLRPAGTLLLAVPPIRDSAEQATHGAIHYHRTNLTIDRWVELLSATGWTIELYRHRYTGSRPLDFVSPYPSSLTSADFAFERVTRDDLYRDCGISVIYRLGSA